MNYVGVRFLLIGGSFLNATVTVEDAKLLLTAVGKSDWTVANSIMFPPPMQFNIAWSVKWESVIAAHTFSLEHQQTPTVPGKTYVSGVPIN